MTSVFLADGKFFGEVERVEDFLDILFALLDLFRMGRQMAVEEEQRSAEDAETDGDAALGAEGTGRPRAQRVRFGHCHPSLRSFTAR